jgi:S-adenosylmethionine synthetase
MRIFTSESVTEGHPDKICDQISDAILDAILTDDPTARVAVETMATTGQIHIAGEVTTSAHVDFAAIARAKILEIGYNSSALGFDGASCGISVSIGAQSPEIANGVSESLEARSGTLDDAPGQLGAGDQGMMFGYATDETAELMPAPIMLAHKLAKELARIRKNGETDLLRPDGKTQVSIAYDKHGTPKRLDTVIVSTQTRSADLRDIQNDVAWWIAPIIGQAGFDPDGIKLLVNPSGSFEMGGPMADAGLTGRKIIVDTYGGMARHGGGAFSGKDPSKVDRSAAYAMRWVAKNVVAAQLASRCEVQVAYAIGVADPVGLYVDTFGTGVISDSKLAKMIRRVFDLRPGAIIADLDLRRPIYQDTARYGHFGWAGRSWEQTNRIDDLLAAVRHQEIDAKVI